MLTEKLANDIALTTQNKLNTKTAGWKTKALLGALGTGGLLAGLPYVANTAADLGTVAGSVPNISGLDFADHARDRIDNINHLVDVYNPRVDNYNDSNLMHKSYDTMRGHVDDLNKVLRNINEAKYYSNSLADDASQAVNNSPLSTMGYAGMRTLGINPEAGINMLMGY